MLTKSPGTPGWPKGGLYIPASSGDYFLQNLVTRIVSDKELRQSSGIPKTVVTFGTFVPFHPFWLQKVVFWALDEVYQLSHKKSSSQSFTVRANYCCSDQQWPQNHQQGSAIQSADASGVNWGLVTEVRWLMQLGVSKANSMREDKEDMTSGWRQTYRLLRSSVVHRWLFWYNTYSNCALRKGEYIIPQWMISFYLPRTLRECLVSSFQFTNTDYLTFCLMIKGTWISHPTPFKEHVCQFNRTKQPCGTSQIP